MKMKSAKVLSCLMAFLLCFLLLSAFLPVAAEDSTDHSPAMEEIPLAVGAKGDRVLELKRRLQELRYLSSGSLTKQYTEKTAAAVKAFQLANGLPDTGIADAETMDLLFSSSALPKPRITLAPLNTPSPIAADVFPERDEEGFLKGEGEWIKEEDDVGLWIYLSQNLQVIIRRMEDATIPLVWFETEIHTRGGERFRTVMTDPDHPGKKFRYPYDIARDEGFVLGFSDDFYATRMADRETVGIIIREGRILCDSTNRTSGHHLPNLDMMIQYGDGSLEVCNCTEYTAEELLQKGALNVFSFGPILLRDGEINDLVYTYYRSIEPRHALGMIEPNHYLLISVQGRTKNSKGTTLQRVAELMKERGVTQALNLDGGNTMALIFRGRMLNKLATYKKKNFVRTVTSLIGIGQTAPYLE